MQVTRLRVYPVKSFAGKDVDSAHVLPWGLADDRRWAVVDPAGEPVTAREANALLSLAAAVLADGGLLLAGVILTVSRFRSPGRSMSRRSSWGTRGRARPSPPARPPTPG